MATNPWVVPAYNWLVKNWDSSELKWRWKYVLNDRQRYILESFKDKHDQTGFDKADGSTVNSISQSAGKILGEPMTVQMVQSERMSGLAALGYEWANMSDKTKKILRETNELVAQMKVDFLKVIPENKTRRELEEVRGVLEDLATKISPVRDFDGISSLVSGLASLRSQRCQQAADEFDAFVGSCKRTAEDMEELLRLAGEHESSYKCACVAIEKYKVQVQHLSVNPAFKMIGYHYQNLANEQALLCVSLRQELNQITEEIEPLIAEVSSLEQSLAKEQTVRERLLEEIGSACAARDTAHVISLGHSLEGVSVLIADLETKIVPRRQRHSELSRQQTSSGQKITEIESRVDNLRALAMLMPLIGACVEDPCLMDEPRLWAERHSSLFAQLKHLPTLSGASFGSKPIKEMVERVVRSCTN